MPARPAGSGELGCLEATRCGPVNRAVATGKHAHPWR